MGENSNSTLIGLTNPETITLSTDETYAHIHLGLGVGTLVIHSEEAAQKLAEVALHCMARLMMKAQKQKLEANK